MWISLIETLNGQAKDTDYAVHGFVLPAYSAAAIGLIVPVAGAGCVQPGPILLHDDTGHNVLERFVQLGQLVQTLLHHVCRPLVYSVVLVGIAANGPLYCFFDDVGHLIHNK